MNTSSSSTENLAQLATNPGYSVVVRACAGSGKTWMLVTRMFRLLLLGVAPDTILAITFTRKAAQEMRQRLDDLIEQCALLDDPALDALLVQRCCEPTPQHRQAARSLAMRVFQSARGVQISTFHGWFTSLCQLAPLSAGFSRQAEPTELPEFWQLKAWRLFMDQIRIDSSSILYQSLHYLIQTIGVDGAKKAILNLTKQRAAWQLFYEKGLRDQTSFPRFSEAEFSQAQSDDDSAAMDFFYKNQYGPLEGLLNEATIFECVQMQDAVMCLVRFWVDGSESERKRALTLEKAWVEHDWPVLWETFRKKEGHSKKLNLTKTALKKLGDQVEATFLEALAVVQTHLELIQDNTNDLHWCNLTVSALNLMPHFISIYDRVKAQAGVVDFDDLELTACRLLNDPQFGAYIQAKIDCKTQHILVDEFQDTNPVQWLILQAWLSQYHQGDGLSVFLVGDPKQSIYRFRRAEARLFDHATQWLVQQFNAKVFSTSVSRRCSAAVLHAVNTLFVTHAHFRLGSTLIEQHHGQLPEPLSAMPEVLKLTNFTADSGVLVFPLVLPSVDASFNPVEPNESTLQSNLRAHWFESHAYFGQQSLGGDHLSEALRVGLTVKDWLQTGQIQSPSDILVLVRRHADGAPLSGVLQSLGIAHTVNNKAGRFASVLWDDTLALLRVLYSPLNALAALQLLRSPFFAIPAVQIGEFLPHLQSQKWADAIGLASQPIALAMQSMSQWRQWAANMSLHEVLHLIFQETDVQIKTVAMAPDVERAAAQVHWQWVLQWALDLQQGRFPDPVLALQQALALADHGSAGTEQSSDSAALRIMTVHAAKGLEAPIVWLYNAHVAPQPTQNAEIKCLVGWPLESSMPLHLSLYSGKQSLGRARSHWFATEWQAVEDEMDHLLYVALTRAQQRVIVSGTASKKDAPLLPGSWYQRLSEHAAAHTIDWLDFSFQSDLAQANQIKELQQSADDALKICRVFKSLPFISPEVGRVLPRQHNLLTRRGIAWHACLQGLDALAWQDFEAWWLVIQSQVAPQLAYLSDAFVEEVRQSVAHLLAQYNLRQFLDDSRAQLAFNEFEFLNLIEKNSCRADRIILLKNQWWIIDYKWQWDSATLLTYEQQLKTYAVAVAQTLQNQGHDKEIKLALLNANAEFLVLSDCF